MSEQIKDREKRILKPETHTDSHQFLTFSMKAEVFGISIMLVREIIEYGRLTKVPMAPDHIKGVINLRGQVVPVIDLARYFGLGITQPGKTTCVVILEVTVDTESEILGILVDSVDEVRSIPENSIESAPGLGAKVHPEFLKGVGKTGTRFILLIDIDKALDIKKLGKFGSQNESAKK
ncbi:MAG: purine-binding chemotaxis protein CheW [Leptospiraceae bacterium]|nr:purine-binding chemotaxis protein CheW [Leptospiraceae bacterium]